MNKNILNISVIAVISVFSFSANAQETPSTAPIFITPYQAQPQTYTSQVPSLVQAEQKNNRKRTYTQSGRVSHKSPQRVSTNPFEGTSFGRIKTEIDYYDKETGKRYNQYDYMGLLAKRGDTARLSQVAGYLQQNAVFNPQKYNAAIDQALNGTPSENQQGSGALQPQPQIQKKQVYVMKNQHASTPQKIHSGYGEDTGQSGTTSRAPNAPIFLK